MVDNVRFLEQKHVRSVLLALSGHPRLQVIVNRVAPSLSPAQDELQLQAQLQDLLSSEPIDITTQSISVHTVSSDQALEAIDAFRGNTSKSNIDIYQAKQTASRMGLLKNKLHNIHSSANQDPINEKVQVSQVQTAAFLAEKALLACQTGFDLADAEIHEARSKMKEFSQLIQAECHKVEDSVIGTSTRNNNVELESVKNSIAQTEKDARALLSEYSWWKLPWKVDDLGSDLRALVKEKYGRDVSDNVRSSPPCLFEGAI